MCTRLTQLYLLVEYKVFFLHKVQLHVSALDNGHLQVVHEILIKQLYKTHMGYLYGVERGMDIEIICTCQVFVHCKLLQRGNEFSGSISGGELRVSLS